MSLGELKFRGCIQAQSHFAKANVLHLYLRNEMFVVDHFKSFKKTGRTKFELSKSPEGFIQTCLLPYENVEAETDFRLTRKAVRGDLKVISNTENMPVKRSSGGCLIAWGHHHNGSLGITYSYHVVLGLTKQARTYFTCSRQESAT